MTPQDLQAVQDAFNGPWKRTVDGVEYTLPRANVTDLLPWCDEITTKRQAAMRAAVPQAINPTNRFLIDRQIATYASTMDDLAGEVGTFAGAVRMIKLCAKAAQLDDAAADKLIAGISPRQLVRDAYRISGLVSATSYLKFFHAVDESGEPTDLSDDPNVPQLQSQQSQVGSDAAV